MIEMMEQGKIVDKMNEIALSAELSTSEKNDLLLPYIDYIEPFIRRQLVYIAKDVFSNKTFESWLAREPDTTAQKFLLRSNKLSTNTLIQSLQEYDKYVVQSVAENKKTPIEAINNYLRVQTEPIWYGTALTICKREDKTVETMNLLLPLSVDSILPVILRAPLLPFSSLIQYLDKYPELVLTSPNCPVETLIENIDNHIKYVLMAPNCPIDILHGHLNSHTKIVLSSPSFPIEEVLKEASNYPVLVNNILENERWHDLTKYLEEQGLDVSKLPKGWVKSILLNQPSN